MWVTAEGLLAITLVALVFGAAVWDALRPE